ncbi:TIGR03619 family F420-dependent LLM class oxidoreductase [Dactylosporangium sp. CA-092794]|uniref:TIGR03619 family F420-dependent LLM class oxidoreductase n=1 Tax=Dactylosporangium sp. CA-092794 TaxID=3239929 RepID=UPI003D90DA65
MDERPDTTRPRLTVDLRSYAADAESADWAGMLRRAEQLDAAGVDRLVVSDHIAFGENLAAYGDPGAGGRTGGVQPTGPDGHWLEPLTTLAVIAGRTTRIRLGTNIILAALRRPAVLAKSAATLDVLSDGRLDLGVGVGWQREEYDVAGLDYRQRGRLLEHTLDVCQLLWGQTRADYRTTELSFEGIHAMPKPLQSGGVPIWISGTVNDRVVRRVARYGRRWIPWGEDESDIDRGIARMRTALAALAGSADELRVSAPLRTIRLPDRSIDVAATLAPVPRLAGAGVTDFRVHLPTTADPAGFVAAFREASGAPR